MAIKRARRAGKTTTTTTTDGAVTVRRRGPATHAQIRLTLDLPGSPLQSGGAITPAPKTLADAIALLHPSQREGLASAAKSGNGYRLVVAFLPSESRDIDEAIRGLPTALQGSVSGAEKL